MPTLNLTPTQAAIAYALAEQARDRYQAAYNELLHGDHGKRQIAAWLDEVRGLCDKLSRLCAEPPRKSHGPAADAIINDTIEAVRATGEAMKMALTPPETCG